MIKQSNPLKTAGPWKAVPFRAEFRRTGQNGLGSRYYHSGELTPYSIEDLLNAIRSEARSSFETLQLTLELRGAVGRPQFEELARRFSSLGLPEVQVLITAPGHAPLSFPLTPDAIGPDAVLPPRKY